MTPEASTMSTGALVTIGALLVAQVTLDVIALTVLVRTSQERLHFQRKWPWVLIILLVGFFGAIAFLAIGRRPAPADDEQATEPSGDDVTRVVRSFYPDDGS